jgi:hypothetical protein
MLPLTDLTEVGAYVFDIGGLVPGVDKSDLETQVVARLVDAGLTVLGAGTVSPEGDIDLGRGFGAPSISVWVKTLPVETLAGDVRGYVLHVNLELRENATVSRSGRVGIVQTYQTENLGYAPHDLAEQVTFQLLNAVLDQFINDWREAPAREAELQTIMQDMQ